MTIRLLAYLVSPILSIRCVIVISSLGINLSRAMTHSRCAWWSELVCTWYNSGRSIWRTGSSCGRAVVRWICHACPTGLVLIILLRFQKLIKIKSLIDDKNDCIRTVKINSATEARACTLNQLFASCFNLTYTRFRWFSPRKPQFCQKWPFWNGSWILVLL